MPDDMHEDMHDLHELHGGKGAPQTPAPTKAKKSSKTKLLANTARAMRIAIPKARHVGKKVEKISEMITENDENTFKNLLSVFDHDDDGALTFEELVDVKKALDTLTGFAEKGPKGVKPSLPLPDLIRTGGVLSKEQKRLDETNGKDGKGVQITYSMFEDRFSNVLADTGAVFKKLDGNQDKEISTDELQDLVTFMPDHLSYLQFSKWYHLRINAQPDMGNLLFDEMDVDNDDVISHDELSRMHRHVHKDRDEALDFEAFKDMFGDTISEHTKEPLDAVFKAMDVQGTGKLDEREMVSIEVMITHAIETGKFESGANPHKANLFRKGRLPNAKPVDKAGFSLLYNLHTDKKDLLGEWFTELDKDNGGTVDEKEIRALTKIGPSKIGKFSMPVFTAWYFDKFKNIEELQKTFVLMDANEDKLLDDEDLEFIRPDLNGPGQVPVDVMLHDPWMGMTFEVFDHRFLNNLVGVLDKKKAHAALDKDANGILTRSELNKLGEILPDPLFAEGKPNNKLEMNFTDYMWWHEERMYMGGAVPARGFNMDEMELQYFDIDLNGDKLLSPAELSIYATPSKADREQYREFARSSIARDNGLNPDHFNPLSLIPESEVHDPTAGIGMFHFMHFIVPHLALKDKRADVLFQSLDKDQDMHLSAEELQLASEYMHDL